MVNRNGGKCNQWCEMKNLGISLWLIKMAVTNGVKKCGKSKLLMDSKIT
jgi:hypothetical protein